MRVPVQFMPASIEAPRFTVHCEQSEREDEPHFSDGEGDSENAWNKNAHVVRRRQATFFCPFSYQQVPSLASQIVAVSVDFHRRQCFRCLFAEASASAGAGSLGKLKNFFEEARTRRIRRIYPKTGTGIHAANESLTVLLAELLRICAVQSSAQEPQG